MTCHECRDLMLDVSQRRAAPSIERSLLAHAESCPSCRDRLARETALTAGLRALAQDANQASASDEVEVRLAAAFAAQHRHEAATRPQTGARQRWLLRAAAVLLSVGGAAWWLKAPAPVPIPVPAVAPRAARVEHADAPGPKAAPELSQSAGRQSPRPARVTRSGRKPERPAPVLAMGFVPIPSAAGLPDFESGEIVRLGIPVTALPNYGLEIPGGTQSAIQADLLVGQDGQARAIRLVNAAADDPRPRR